MKNQRGILREEKFPIETQMKTAFELSSDPEVKFQPNLVSSPETADSQSATLNSLRRSERLRANPLFTMGLTGGSLLHWLPPLCLFITARRPNIAFAHRRGWACEILNAALYEHYEVKCVDCKGSCSVHYSACKYEGGTLLKLCKSCFSEIVNFHSRAYVHVGLFLGLYHT